MEKREKAADQAQRDINTPAVEQRLFSLVTMARAAAIVYPAVCYSPGLSTRPTQRAPKRQRKPVNPQTWARPGAGYPDICPPSLLFNL